MAEIVKAESKLATVRSMLERNKGAFATALPRSLTPERFVRIALTTLSRTPALLECSQASLAGALLQSAQLGLDLDPALGYAYIVPYGQTATFIPGYRGLMLLAYRSGEVSSIRAEIVYEGDEFKEIKGRDPDLVHVPVVDLEKRGKIRGAYAIARFKDGREPAWVYMPIQEIEAIKRRSRAAGNGPWVTDPEAMIRKTVVRQLAKWLPLSSEDYRLQKAVALDEAADAGLPQPVDAPVELALEGPPPANPSTGGEDAPASEPQQDPSAQPPTNRLGAAAAAARRRLEHLKAAAAENDEASPSLFPPSPASSK